MDEKFVKTKGKQRMDRGTYNKEQVTAPTFNDDYGRLIDVGYVVFDFDDQPYVEIISRIIENSKLKCKRLITTRGMHFMFKTPLNQVKNRNKEYNWIGLQCDIKGVGLQENKKVAYQAIKVNGKTRKEEFMNGATNNEELDYAPKWLYHIQKKKDQIDLTEDQTGNRNDLFHSKLMIKAKKQGFSYEEYVQMAHIINEYVLPQQLEEDELNTAIRPEEWDNLEIGEEKQLLIEMAQDVINYWGCLWNSEQIVFFNQDVNRFDTREIILKGYLQEKYQSQSITISKIKEILEQMKILLQTNSNYIVERTQEYVLCDKELVSVVKDEVKPNSRTVYTDIYYPYKIMTQEEFDNFNGRAKSFMKEISCNDSQIEQVIWECIGCMLAPVKMFGKIFIFYGSGANGKSLLLKVIKRIMGEKMTHTNILAINDKFALEGVIDGICNVTDDVGITTLKETGILKSLIDGGSIEVQRKYKSSLWWKPESQFVICCNEVPRIKDTTPGMVRRLAFIPFDLQLRDEQIDIKLEMKLTENIDNLRYILTGGIFAYREAIERGCLTEITKQKDLLSDFLDENKSPIDLFYDHLLEREGNGDKEKFYRYLNGKTTEEIYTQYQKYRGEDKGIEIQRTFTRQFKKKLPCKVELKNYCIGGNSFKTYTLKEE